MQYDFPDVEKARQKKVDPMIAEIWNIVYNDDPIWKKIFFSGILLNNYVYNIFY